MIFSIFTLVTLILTFQVQDVYVQVWPPKPNNPNEPYIDWPDVVIIPYRSKLKCKFSRYQQNLIERIDFYINGTQTDQDYGHNKGQNNKSDPYYNLRFMEERLRPVGSGIWKCQITLNNNWQGRGTVFWPNPWSNSIAFDNINGKGISCGAGWEDFPFVPWRYVDPFIGMPGIFNEHNYTYIHTNRRRRRRHGQIDTVSKSSHKKITNQSTCGKYH